MVYPRVCGGTSARLRLAERLDGLSPRVRGNHELTITAAKPVRSIPACAGEPIYGNSLDRCNRVYPRVCGGTVALASPAVLMSGLSPRVRGNLSAMTAISLRLRSIPACAGEPPSAAASRYSPRVYPRVCGGTDDSVMSVMYSWGLSPRVRGNRYDSAGRLSCQQSIPACAGEPAGQHRM